MANILSEIDWSALIAAIPSDIITLVKGIMAAIIIWFVLLIIRNIIQIGAAWRMRTISKNVQQINLKMDSLINQSVTTEQLQQEEQYEPQYEYQ